MRLCTKQMRAGPLCLAQRKKPKAIGQMATNRNGRPPLVAPKRTPKKAPPKRGAALGALISGLGRLFRRRRRAPAPSSRRPRRGNLLTRAIRYVFGGILRIFWWVGLRVAIVLALIVGTATAYYYVRLPDSPRALMDEREQPSITMLDRNGEVFAWRGDQFGGLVSTETVAPHLKNAVIATEDKRFYRHLGISPRGIIGAMRINVREGRRPWQGNGGSTITQQVAKRVFFSELPALERKLKEVPMAFAMELKYSKDDILEIYMNRAYLGAGSYGFEAAAQRYFSKSASEVSLPEAAMLAGLLKAPSATAPTRNIEAAQNRANLIIGLMEEQGYITPEEAAWARANPAQLSDKARERIGDYFADWVVETAPEFLIEDAREDILLRTTFDRRIQKAAEEALAYIFEEKVRKGSQAQAAIVVLSRDGAVRAMVGGRSTGVAGHFNRATQALRQTGSSFKPFIYATALNDGWRYDTRVVDEPVTLNIPGSGPWSPKNYTGEYKGEMTLTDALAQSINTVAVKVSEAVGRDRVRETARRFGIVSPIADGPAIALGASEATLLEMTGAYAGFLNGGVAVRPFGIQELTIQGEDAPLMTQADGIGERVISEEAAGQLVYMLNQVVERGSGRRARIEGVEIAGKTGTTQGARDAWFIGFTSDFVVGVWMGYDDNRRLTGVTGGGLPAAIWRETVSRVIEGTPQGPLPMYRPPPLPEAPVAEQRRDSFSAAIDRATRQVERDLREAEREAETVLNRVLKGIFGGN